MLRGFRWQFALLVIAIVLLGAAILLRPTAAPTQPQATVPPAPTTPPPTPEPGQTVLSTPLPPLAGDNIATYHEGLVGDVHRLNPLFAALNPIDRDITRLIFEGLVGTNAYGEYVPVLAESWTISGDGLEYVFRLRQDVLWQDGLPFSAADVAATVALLQAPGDALPDDLTSFWQTVEFELLDEHTVRFRLAQPLAAFLEHLRLGILPAHVFTGYPVAGLAAHPFNLSPIGTGPYQLESLTGEDGQIAAVSLRVAPVYRERPEGEEGFALERLTFHLYPDQAAALDALAAGEIDALGNVEESDIRPLEQAGAIETYITTAPVIGLVLFNWESENTAAFRDQRARRALLLGTDRDGLVSRHLGGRAVPADSPIPANLWAYSGPIAWPAYDPAQAAELIAQVDFAPPQAEATATPENDAETTEAEATATPTPTPTHDFVLLSSDDPALVALADELAAQWSYIGLTVERESVPMEDLQARLESGGFDAALVELSYSPHADPDPYSFWHQGQYGEGQNYGGVNDRRSSELIELARRDPNGLHRAEYYAEFQQVFVDRALALLLYAPVYQYAVQGSVDGVRLGYLSTPADRFRNIQGWTLGG